MKNILKDLGLSVDNSKLESLFKRINKQNPAAQIKTREPGYIDQSDLLIMPHDNDYKYIPKPVHDQIDSNEIIYHVDPEAVIKQNR